MSETGPQPKRVSVLIFPPNAQGQINIQVQRDPGDMTALQAFAILHDGMTVIIREVMAEVRASEQKVKPVPIILPNDLTRRVD